jgi:hypothetical protein
MNLDDLIKSFGGKSEGEITACCNAVSPEIASYEQARLFLWKIFQRLVDSKRTRAASNFLNGLGWTEEFKEVIATRNSKEPKAHLDDYDRLILEWL